MTRGKYGARAANRAAAIDNQVIADLRAKLAATETERDAARNELAAQQRRAAADRNRLVQDMMAAERAATANSRQLEAEGLAAWKQLVCDEIVELLAAWVRGLKTTFGDDAPVLSTSLLRPDTDDGPSVLRVIGLLAGDDTAGAGEIIDYITDSTSHDTFHGGRSRQLRRRSVAKLSRDLEFATRLANMRGGQAG